MAASAIQVENLSKTYVSGVFRRKRFPALDEVSFAVNRGEIFGLLGQNGAGKTTFIKILLGIIRKSGGRAELLGLAAGNRSARMKVGYLPENLRVPRHMTGYTALEYYGQLSGLSVREIIRRRLPILERVGLVERAKDSVTTYSKGMLQRLGLAQAMLHEPEVFVLDEPTDGLDPIARQQVRKTLGELKAQGKTVFLNSHILQEVELVCDRVAILDRGKLRFCGPVAELTTNRPALADAVLTAENGAWLVRWELYGDADAIAAAAEPFPVLEAVDLAPGRRQLLTRLRGQADLDRMIDALRSRGVSIQSLTPQRASLEDAYVRIVAENAS